MRSAGEWREAGGGCATSVAIVAGETGGPATPTSAGVMVAATRWRGGFVNAEASGLIVVGSGTTTVTLTYLIWAVFQQPALQEALQRELRDSLERISEILI